MGRASDRRDLVAAGLWLAIATIALGAVVTWSPPGWLAFLGNALVVFLVFRLQAATLPEGRRLPEIPLLVASALSLQALTAVALSAPAATFAIAAAVLVPAAFAATAISFFPARAGSPRSAPPPRSWPS